MNWFETINNKANKKLVKFDIVNFYPSIKYDELEKTLEFVSKFINITTNEVKIIKHTCIVYCQTQTDPNG